MSSVCFRFDDCSARSDHKLEDKIFKVFADLDVPLCVAAIPFAGVAKRKAGPLSSHNAPHLFEAAKAGLIEIAQHGHSHLHRSDDDRGRRSEFAGTPEEEQTRLIEEGKDHLACAFGQRITGFVPPWNTYDQATVRALERAGFEFLSAGFTVSRTGTLPVVPITCTLPGARASIESARRFEFLAPVIVILFHSDDFEEYRSPPRSDEELPATNLHQLELLLRWIKAQAGVRVLRLGEIGRSAGNDPTFRIPSELSLPYRIKKRLPSMIVRKPVWRMLPAIAWSALLNGHTNSR